MLKKTAKYPLGFILYIFCALFAPPLFSGINFILILAAYSLVAIVIKYRKESILVLNRSTLKRLALGIGLYYLYLAIVVIASIVAEGSVQLEHYTKMIYSFGLLFPVSFICVLYILLRSRELRYTLKDLITVFVFAGLVQSLIALATLVSPDMKAFFVNLMYINTGDQLLNTPWVVNVRYFGFANSMLDLFGFGMGILAVLSLFLATERSYKYLFLFPILLIPSLLNARTGLLVGGVGILFFIVYLALKRRMFAVIVTVLALTLVAIVGFKITQAFAPDTITWVSRDVTSFVSSSSQDGTANNLFSEKFWLIPVDIVGLIFGTGHTLYQARGFEHSDVGYINDLWRTGIVGMALLYIPFLLMFRRSINWGKDNLTSILASFFMIIISMFLIKGGFWVYSPGLIIILSLMFYSILIKNERRSLKEIAS